MERKNDICDIVKHPVTSAKSLVGLLKEVLEFEARPGSSDGWEPEISLDQIADKNRRTLQKDS